MTCNTKLAQPLFALPKSSVYWYRIRSTQHLAVVVSWCIMLCLALMYSQHHAAPDHNAVLCILIRTTGSGFDEMSCFFDRQITDQIGFNNTWQPCELGRVVHLCIQKVAFVHARRLSEGRPRDINFIAATRSSSWSLLNPTQDRWILTVQMQPQGPPCSAHT